MTERVAKNDPWKLKRRRARERRGEKAAVAGTRNGQTGGGKLADRRPPPRLGVFSGDDPTLADRFEEELYKRKDD